MGNKEAEEKVRSWGFKNVFTWSDGPNEHYSPHSHPVPTTHLIIAGEMTVWFPYESDSKKVTYGAGARIDVEAGRVHEVRSGPEGVTYVTGE